jgi:hypothetical protein
MRAPYIAATAVIFASVGITTPAFAQKYQAFGNGTLEDCTYETVANLTLHEYPNAHITTAEVIAAWDPNSTGGGNDSPVNGIDPSQLFMQATGFDGHRAKSATREVFSQPQLVFAANHGGIYVSVTGPVLNHAFAIIGATRTMVTMVNDGQVVTQSWSWFRYIWTHQMIPVPGSTTGQGEFVPTGEVLTYFAVTWR